MRSVLLSLVAVLVLAAGALAQVRVTPKSAKGGTPEDKAWEVVPEGFRQMKFPVWPMPTDLKAWQGKDRAKTRETVLKLLGDLPPRPTKLKARVTAKEEHDGYTLEKFEFDNGVDGMVPGVLLIPKNLKKPAPAILVLHGHGSGKAEVCLNEKNYQCVGPMLARKGYVVAAIDAYFSGDRAKRGPGGQRDKDYRAVQSSLFKMNLWMGRTLWGMMLRDEQILIDYLCTRAEVDKNRIGSTGMSMGSTRSWWLAAIDDRVKAMVGVVCFTRYQELIAHGYLRAHGFYYFVPNVLKHFDMEAIFALIAPRPVLMLSGDQDPGSPTDGIEIMEKKLGQFYKLYGKPDNFQSVIYKNTGHEYLPEMKEAMLAWFEKHLPVKK